MTEWKNKTERERERERERGGGQYFFANVQLLFKG